MSDFDNFFAEKLDEEGRFPRKDKNWKTLSGRLDAFETGAQGAASRLRWWQSAVAVSLVLVGTLVWKIHDLRQENRALQHQVVVLQEKQSGEKAGETAYKPESQINKIKNTTAENDDKSLRHYPPYPVPHAFNKTSGHRKSIPAGNTAAKQETPGVMLPPNNPVLPETARPAGHTQDSMSAFGIATFKTSLPPVAIRLLPVNSLAPEEKAPLATVVAFAPLTKPFRHNYSRFRLGMQAVAGLPQSQNEGISAMTGSGIAAEYEVLSHLRVAASADWLHYEVKSNRYLDNCHLPTIPVNPNHELTRIEGSQRSQHLSLGIGYTLPVQWWIRPGFRAYHTWMRMSPAVYYARIEDNDPGGGGPGGGGPGGGGPGGGGPGGGPGNQPNGFFSKKLDTKWFDNIWRLGIGLEHETPRWVFSVSADYSKSLGLGADDSIFDAVVLRGGIQYKFD